MRGANWSAVANGDTAVDGGSTPRFAKGVAVAPDTATPVTAVPAPDPTYPEASWPTTAVPAGGMDWYGPKRWDGWGGGPVPPPRPPEWRGRPRPDGGRPVRRVVGSVVVISLATLLAAGGLVMFLKSGARSPSPRSSGAARPNAAAPGAASPTPTTAPDTAAILSSVTKSVVTITSTLGLNNTRVTGTGVVLTGDGLVLTNNHVIAGATAITGVAVANGHAFQAGVVGFDRSHDIAVIRLVNATGLPRIAVADSSTVKAGDPIFAVGGVGNPGAMPNAVTGSVAALNQSVTSKEPGTVGAQRLDGLLQVAADIRSADSGGPLVDGSGRLVGINTAVDPDQAAGGKGFAIPSNAAVAVAQQIQAGNASSTIHIGPTALLGVGTADATGQVPGAAVTGVLAGGPAQRAGLATGDVIRSVDGQAVDSARALRSMLDTYRPGDEIRIDWVDQAGHPRTATARLVDGPAG